MFPTDEDILNRLTDIEDATVERKVISDNRDWIKAAVAFSNSLADGQPGILFIGVRNNGTIENRPANFEELQKKISGELSNIYPPINPTIRVMGKEGKKFAAVIIYGSAERPHFAGKSYVRDGTQTIEASSQQFDRMIAARTGKVAEISKWVGQEIRLRKLNPPEQRKTFGQINSEVTKILQDCNQHWLTLRDSKYSPILSHYPLGDVTLSFDGQCLVLIVEWSPP